ncbi:50S ribosomal protein L23 [Candidatus Erwinia haradaeae]|uniref:Large ribosomal subunit protein uL23 n=1 Tax=Candidatus Erwinia haradaeae TaxID=1922217 RepID=A0A451D9M5_9GAMM|nr:50S ribosomal protein L23 [Candidatus Erwinia haradaeae]VFP83021.1 50S ribosomal protein L23 [Candidatus Erwinia haradaeae]
MNLEERLLRILRAPHVSEKASSLMDKDNTIVFKVTKDASKVEIKSAIKSIFKVEVDSVNTLLVKGKIKRHKKRLGRRKDWKKAYISLKEGQNITDVVGSSE